jgi:ATP-dependent protease Clp ATPase subunit
MAGSSRGWSHPDGGPQFLARFDAVVLLNDLDDRALAKIFLETPDSGYQQARAWFESRGQKLALSDEAVERIALAASRTPRLGARALREVFRRVIRNYEFEPERYADASGVVHLGAEEVEQALKRRG